MPRETADSADRRQRRQESQALFDGLAADVAARPGVSRGAMFGSEGLKFAGSFIAFVGHDGRLIVKLPADRVQAIIATGDGDPVQTGARPMREWVGVPLPDDGGTDRWRVLLEDAYVFAVRRTGNAG